LIFLNTIGRNDDQGPTFDAYHIAFASVNELDFIVKLEFKTYS